MRLARNPFSEKGELNMSTTTYKPADAKTNTRRSFRVTCGLREGYAERAITHTVGEFKEYLKVWMVDRGKGGMSYLTGTVIAGDVVYAWSDGGIYKADEEPAAVFQGEVSVLYNADLTDEEVTGLLNDLGAYLGNALNQYRVYISYRDETWVLQQEK
jgi:hypothetical protein